MFFGYLALLTSVVLTLIAGFFSVSGMMALFAANAIGVGVMMSCLEFAKVVTAGWLKMNWTKRTIPMIHKAYLTVATVVLMLITSLGIYGYLSAGHLEQQAPLAGVEMQAQGLERQIATKEAEIKRTETRLAQIDRNIESFLSADKATAGLRASASLQKEKDKLQASLDARNAEVNSLNEKLMPIKEKGNAVEAKLGPIKYVADLFGMKDPESAVRIVIVMIMLVFDPLAVALMISGIISLTTRKSDDDADAEPVADLPPVEDEITSEIEPIAPEEAEALPVAEVTIEESKADAAPDAVTNYELVETAPSAEAIKDGDIKAYIDTIFQPVTRSVETGEIIDPVEAEVVATEEETVEAVEPDVVAKDEPVAEPTVEPAPAGNIIRELEDERVGMSHRERLIELLEQDKGFLQEVMDIAAEIKLARAAEEDARIHGGGASTKAPEKAGADF